jgi:hypothetical protein
VSHEGVTLISRALLVLALIVATAFVRAVVGPDRKRGLIMNAGTLGGLSAGIALATVLSRWVLTDVSVICACLGIIVGWSVAWRFARRVPRNAS